MSINRVKELRLGRQKRAFLTGKKGAAKPLSKSSLGLGPRAPGSDDGGLRSVFPESSSWAQVEGL